MNKKDLDDLADLYESVYSSIESSVYLSEIPINPAASRTRGPVRMYGANDSRRTNNQPYRSPFQGRADLQRRVAAQRSSGYGSGPVVSNLGKNYKGQELQATARANASQVKPTKPAAPAPAARPAAPAPAATLPAAAKPAPSSGSAKVAPSSASKPAATTGASKVPPASSSASSPAAPKKSFNPLMQKTFGYQTGYAPDQIKNDPKKMAQMGSLKNIASSYEWSSAKTIRDIADAYSSIYEAKKKDQDKDGDNDFADVRIARMIASGVPKEVAVAKVKGKSYNEEVEIDEATRMRKELGKEGETATRKELAARSRGHQRSASVDKTIAAAEREADRTTFRKRDESEGDYGKRMQKRSQTLRGLASSRRKSVRGEGGLRGYAAKVEGGDKDLQSARGSARSAGTLTPKEKKQMGEEYTVYEIVASYLLENNFAETLNDANVIIENMSETWVAQILESFE